MRSASREAELLLAELCREPRETSWLEFKENKADPEGIGEYVSALSNAAALAGRARAYLVWGVRDGDHRVVGTTFDPYDTKVGNEDLVPWLIRLVVPQVGLTFTPVPSGDVLVWILEIDAARDRPVSFRGREFIRVGSYKKPLRDNPDFERRLWRTFEREVFETGVAADRITSDDVLRLIDYPTYFSLLDLPLPESRSEILTRLEADRLVTRSAVGWAVTNLGAVLFGRNLSDFDSVKRKYVRVIQYRGTSRVETIREQEGTRGYASGFEGLIAFIDGLLPRNEVIGQALRDDRPLYPQLAIRELVANMLIHQDFSITGTGPTVEIFDDRMEITNPGAPIIDALRFVDHPPRSRNEALASMMRRAHICEERGTGWDKVASQTEVYQLPAPYIEVTGDYTKAVLLAPRSLTRMDRRDRVRAVYLHACLRHVSGERTTNSSVRARFGISSSNSPQASRLLGEATDAGLIALYDPDAGYRSRQYVPFWAASELV